MTIEYCNRPKISTKTEHRENQSVLRKYENNNYSKSNYKKNNNHLKVKTKINYQIKAVSKSDNKSDVEGSRSRSPNFNTSISNDQPRDNTKDIISTNEFLTFLTTHNRTPYSTTKTRINYNAIKNKLNPEHFNTEGSLNNVNNLLDNKLKDFNS